MYMLLRHELLAKLLEVNITHCLPVRGRVDYKIAVLCYKAVKLQRESTPPPPPEDLWQFFQNG